MPVKTREELILLGKVVTAVVAIIGGIWFFGRAPFNEKVNGLMDSYIISEHYKANHRKLTKEYVDSPAFKVWVDKVIEDYEATLFKNSSGQISLRKLLAGKMGVPEDEVHIELGRLFKAEKSNLKGIEKTLRKIVKEILKQHPSSGLNID